MSRSVVEVSKPEPQYDCGMPAVTIIDLARELGLSKTTVSDALIGSGRVSEATRQRVMTAAQSMGYVSNRAARSLRRRTTGAFGLYIPSEVRGLSFYMHFAFGAADAAASVGRDLTLHTRTSEHFQVDGAIVIDALDDDPIVDRMLRAAIPIVFAGRSGPLPLPAQTVGTIEIDHRAVVDFVLEQLKSTGTRRPGYVGLESLRGPHWAADSKSSFEEWCLREGIEPHMLLLPADPNEDELFAALEKLTGECAVDAIVFGPQGLAGRALPMLHSLGKTPDVNSEHGFRVASLAGDPVSELGSSQIFAVDLAPRSFGHEAMDLLVEVSTAPPSETLHRFHAANLHRTVDASDAQPS